MVLPIFFAAVLLTAPDQPLAAHLREITPKRLLTEDHAEELRIDQEVQSLYSARGLLTVSDIGEEASYDLLLLLSEQPRAVQNKVFEALLKPEVEKNLPPDGVTYFRTRYRLEAVKAKSKETHPTNPDLRDTINKLYETDQGARQQQGFDPQKLEATDKEHLQQLKAILEEHGVPTFSMVGPDAAGHFVMLIQHQPAALRELALPLLRKEVDKGEADPESYALVYDLSQVDQGKPQRYGERLVCQAGKLQEAPIEDPSQVDQRRAEIGLMRLGLYTYLVQQSMPQMCSGKSS